MIHKRIVRYGEYLPQKEREGYGKDLRATHFRLGSDGENTVSSYVYDYRKFSPEDMRKDKDAPEIASLALAKKGLKFGFDKIPVTTSYNFDYPPKYGGKADLNKDVLKDLRATHYELGTDPRSFGTIHKQDYVEKELARRDPEEIRNTRVKMRTQNFKFGDDPVNYETSTALSLARQPPRPVPLYVTRLDVVLKRRAWI